LSRQANFKTLEISDPWMKRDRGAVLAQLLEWLEGARLVGSPLRYLRLHFWRLFRYGIVGTSIAALNVLTFYVLKGALGLPDAVAVTGMYVIAVVVHFFSHRRITFKAHEQEVRPQGGRYVVMLLLNFALYQITVALAPRLGFSAYLGVVVAALLTIVINFLMMNHFVFGRGTS
jgi:putative flippase GtrA